MADLFSVTVEWNGVDLALDRVAGFGDDLRPLGPALFDEWISPEEQAWFDSEGEGTWSISAEYARRKTDLYGNLPIEQLPDQTLLKSLTDRGAADSVYEVSAGEIVYGSSVVYAGVQDERNPLIFPLTEDRLGRLDAVVMRELASFTRVQGLEVI